MQTSLTREVDAVRIPSGEKLRLPAGSEVIITQSLGGSFTVHVPREAGLYRISGADADALGKEVAATELNAPGEYSEEAVWDQLRTCYDPEIPVNIVDLGLIYSLEAKDENGGKHLEVRMTLTAPGCGMGPMLASDARERILQVPGVTSANVELVWEPQWTPDRISPEGRKKLGIE